MSPDGTCVYVAGFHTGNRPTTLLDSFIPDGGEPFVICCAPIPNPENAKSLAQPMNMAVTRGNNGISVVDLRRKQEIAHVTMYNLEPKSIVKVRRFLYDASFTSSHGDSSCASCHIFGDFDSLAWDLGNPDDTTTNNPGPFVIGPATAHAGAAFTQFVSKNRHVRHGFHITHDPRR